MKKLTTLCGCIIALVVFATWAPNASATNSLYDNNCADCHGTVRTCAGCHAHGVHPSSSTKRTALNVSATPDSAIYLPGDTISVDVTGGYRAGWVRVQMWDRNCSTAGTCTQVNALVSESFLTSGTEVNFPGPVTLTATAPNTPGDYTWYAGWYGNGYDVSNPAIGLWIPDDNNSGHGNELVAFSFTVATAPETNCSDGIDNDGDGLVDCNDQDCQLDPVCQLPTFETDCADGVDNDGDGFIDCADSDCDADPICQPPPVEDCADGVDNDGDGLVDCADQDCAAELICQPPVEDCTDGVDNDGDGFIDCTDQDCAAELICQPVLDVEDCTDGVDNDGDNFIDCADPDCAADPLCSPPEACPQFVPPGDHIVLEGDDNCRALHARGLDKPFSNGCTACHGNELTGPASGGFAPSCFTCHDREWDEDAPAPDDGDHDDDDDDDEYYRRWRDSDDRSRRWSGRGESDD